MPIYCNGDDNDISVKETKEAIQIKFGTDILYMTETQARNLSKELIKVFPPTHIFSYDELEEENRILKETINWLSNEITRLRLELLSYCRKNMELLKEKKANLLKDVRRKK